MVLEILVGSAALTAAGGVGYVLYENRRQNKQMEKERDLAKAAFRSALVREIQRTQLVGFDFSQFVETSGIDRDDADGQALDIFAKMAARAAEDGTISDAERRQLDKLAGALEITIDLAHDIETQEKERAYSHQVKRVLADGAVSPGEMASLTALRKSLGIGRERAFAIDADRNREAYIAMFRRIAGDGIITAEERSELDRCRIALAISDEEAANTIRAEALDIYRECFTSIVQDGEVTPEEEECLQWLQTQTGLSHVQLDPYLQRLANVKCLAEYRQGHLPAIRTRRMLEAGEICHWEGPAFYQYETARTSKSAQGDLIVTSKNVIYHSPTKTFSFSPAKLLDLGLVHNALSLQVNGRQGSGLYFVGNPTQLEAILFGLAKRHKFLVSENFDAAKTRHIPREVKVAVWSRDGGCCVGCRATEYLEFDHIIPHSRGGSNGEKNIQLLCRKCNLAKSDRIG